MSLPRPWDLPEALRDPAAQRDAVLHLAGQVDARGPWPDLVEHLLRLGATDVVLGRLTEGHLDAVRILDQAALDPVPDQAYAVWASRSEGTGIHGERIERDWVLDGRLRFASGIGVVDRALVPVWTSDGRHLLLDLDVTSWPHDDSAWRSPAMALSRSHTVHLDRVVAHDVTVAGRPDFYLERRGFHLGGIGVAAVWAGCAARVLALAERAVTPERRTASRVRRIGLARAEALTAAAVVRQAGREADTAPDPRHLATWSRAAVVAAATRVVEHAREVSGAAALAHDAELAAAVVDLPLYLAQHDTDGAATWLGEQDPPGPVSPP